MSRGGARKGAGNKTKYTFAYKLRLANEVTLIQRELGVSRDVALEVLYNRGLLGPGYREIKRYLTPSYLKKEIIQILESSERKGILAAISPLENSRKS